MNTIKISNAQLNVSNYYTAETINKLINLIEQNGLIAYYNTETKSIDVESDDINKLNVDLIKLKLKEWLNNLSADDESIRIMCNNIDFIFNITQINSSNGPILKVYLY